MFIINKYHLEELIAEAKKKFPKEACGVLAGKDSRVYEIISLTNENNSAVSYFASPKEQLRAFKMMREKGLNLVAIYHSHPHSQAWPSSTDLEQALYPEATNIIISLMSLNSPVVRAFKYDDKLVKEVEIKIKEDRNANTNIYKWKI